MFEYFETMNRREREETAARLEALYNKYRDAENETFLAARTAPRAEYEKAQKDYLYALGRITAIQTVFHELHIPFN